MNGLRPKILSYHRNIFRLHPGARLIVDDRVHFATRHNVWSGSCYIELGRNSTLHFKGRCSFRGEAFVVIGDNAMVTVGDHVNIRERLWVRADKEITIGDYTTMSKDTVIIDSDMHPVVIDGQLRPMQAPVHIGDHVWISADCTILKGVTIGPETIVGAGSLVSKDLPDHCLAVGRPAVPVKKVDFGRYDPRIHKLPPQVVADLELAASEE